MPYRTKLPLLCYTLFFTHNSHTHTYKRRTAKYAKSSATHTHLQAGRCVCACVCGIECTSWVALQLPSTKEKAAKLKRTPALTATERRLTAKRRQCILFLILDSMSACADQQNSGAAAAERFARALSAFDNNNKSRKAQQKQRCVDKHTQANKLAHTH